MTNISTVQYQDCCGCSACYNKCPVNAIKMKENKEGFFVPAIDDNKCTNCGLCLKSCPSLNVQFKNTDKPECYAAMASDDIRKISSSGGVFTLLAQNIISRGGYVCGAAFDEKWNVEHIIVNTEEGLAKLRGSKYVQSAIGNCYKEIKKILNDGKPVLFSGCPCQVAGLYSFLDKEYDNLYTVDLVCHGAPSREVWRRYLNENFKVDAIKKVDFRDKSLFKWSTCMNIYFKDERPEVHENHKVNPFYRGFLPNLILGKHCAICKYSRLPRQADITLGDWWGIDNFVKGMNDKMGTSQILVNSPKGKELYGEISSRLTLNYDIGLETTLKSTNHPIFRAIGAHPKRQVFFDNLNKMPVVENIINILENKYDVCLLTTFYSKNYGAMLVAYAANYVISQLGYSVVMLQKLTTQWPGYPIKNTIPMNFAEKYYNITKEYRNEVDLIDLNNKCKNFVVGSDQMFSWPLRLDFAFLGWVNNCKNKIAFSTSFGHDKYPAQENDLLKKKYNLHRFNHIALREKTENLCNIFDIDPEELIDPSLMVERKAYEKLADTVDMPERKPFVLTYILDLNDEKIKIIKYIAEKLNLEIVNIQNLDFEKQLHPDLPFEKNYTPEEFLYLYKHAAFVITDSYHGTCFSVKFNKKFISIINIRRGGIRYKMFDPMNINHRFITSFEDIQNSNIIFEDIDYTQANAIIEEKASFAIEWIKNALENNTNSSIYSERENFQDIIIKDMQIKAWRLETKLNSLEKIVKDEANKKENSIKSFMKTLFAVTNDRSKRHKVICIFGLKIKFKRKIK